ncbi:hypothetical protein ACLEPN_29615 [Myxococcus sp. 1LA]
MTVLLGVALGVLLVLSAVLLVVVRRFQDEEYWRARWRSRYEEKDTALGEALSEAQEFKAALLDGAFERVSVEQALRTLWRRIDVQTPADGAAVAVLRAAFPALPLPPGARTPVEPGPAPRALAAGDAS